VTVHCENVRGSDGLPGSPYDGVVANLQTHLLLPLLPGLTRSLLPSGWLVVSGVLGEEHEAIISAAPGASLLFVESEEEDGWWTGVFRRSAEPV
jgi:ribosomal protein L11 methylase PrmA